MIPDENESIHILVVDDEKREREWIRTLIRSSMSEAKIVGEAENGKEAVDLARMLQPDVILMDFKMPDENGIDATRRIHAENQHIGVIILTQFGDDDILLAALRAGARGYLLKGGPKADVVRAIRAVYQGEAIFSPGVARRLITIFTTQQPTSFADSFPELTKRELETLELMSQRLDDAEIASRMGIRKKTVQNYRDNIYLKLQVHDKISLFLEIQNRSSGAKSCPWCGKRLP